MRLVKLKKETLFKGITILLPVVLILSVETVLFLFNYGENYNLFNKVTIENKPGYLVMNSEYAKKYFKNMDFSPDNQSDLFLKTKTDSTFRVFVMGASTTVGFPYYRGGSFPRILKHRLSQTFPDKNIEVVNTGITAVNSYTLWDITNDIIKQKPDLIIIYAGHNEYYGALGVGSTSSFGSHPWLIRLNLILKEARLFQLLENSYNKFITRSDKTFEIGETTLMEVMAQEQQIPLNSDVYRAGIDQFEGNMKKVLQKFNSKNIPVILSTVVCNEKDVKPFISDSLVDEPKFISWIEAGNQEAELLAKYNADAAYLLGKYYLSVNPDSAEKYLHRAKELDLLRFRAPAEINKTIIKLADRYNCHLIDMEEVFLKHSDHNVIGDELLSEHVHPNIMGYFLMADACYEKVKEIEVLPDWNYYISYEDAVIDIPITAIDSMVGELIINDLKKSWPYDLSMSGTKPISPYYTIHNPSYEQRKAIEIYIGQSKWSDVMIQSYNKYKNSGLYEEGLRVAQSLIFEYPEKANFYNLAGDMAYQLNDLDKAAFYYKKNYQLNRNSQTANKLATIYTQLNKLESAMEISSQSMD